MSKIAPTETVFTQRNIGLYKTAQAGFDLVLLSGAFFLAYLLRFDFVLTPYQLKVLLIQMLVIVPFQYWVLRMFKVHKLIWRYVSLPDLNRILSALFVASLPLLIIRFSLYNYFFYPVIPVSIIILDFGLAVIGILGLRLCRREVYEILHRVHTAGDSGSRKSTVLLIGAGRAGVMTLAEIKNRGDIDIDVRGFIDDDPTKNGAIINGVKVMGNSDRIPDLVKELEIDYVIISIAQASREDFKRILGICRGIPIKVRTIPGLYELLQDKVSISRIRDVEIEDLLGRSPVMLDQASIESYLQQKVIMVTGAGGSIGSELVRQLVNFGPERLILVERSEFALFQIEQEIKTKYPDFDVVPVIGDICDEVRMTNVFKRFSPQVVFHAAAHKHVPMMEQNASEALRNNILGTRLMGRLSGNFGSEAFVLISTDKAVNPTSVMGATKRLSEFVVQDLNERFETRFLAVRFGNVIGSTGSVIPTFREQINNGGPLTVTHPKMERFFMTIPEAAQLVLQAGAIGVGGAVLVLDMGKPVNILDLAKETIRLSGLKPDIDIKIAFTGIRKGEKLVEELQSDKEQLSKTIHPKIFVGKIGPYPSSRLAEVMDIVRELCVSEDDQEIRRFLNTYLPEANLETSGEDQNALTGNELPLSTEKAKLATANG